MLAEGKNKVKNKEGNVMDIRKQMMPEYKSHRNQKILTRMEHIYKVMNDDQKQTYQMMMDGFKNNRKLN
jgi:hypothetical protein